MTVVLDPDVIISALLSPQGSPAEIIKRWETDQFVAVISPALLTELKQALEYQRVRKYFKRPQETVAALIKRLETVATVVEPQFSLDVIKENPAYNQVLECALAGEASYIVTGNAHLLRLKEYRGVVILNPAGLLALAKLGELV